jgi:hypothetical protein
VVRRSALPLSTDAGGSSRVQGLLSRIRDRPLRCACRIYARNPPVAGRSLGSMIQKRHFPMQNRHFRLQVSLASLKPCPLRTVDWTSEAYGSGERRASNLGNHVPLRHALVEGRFAGGKEHSIGELRSRSAFESSPRSRSAYGSLRGGKCQTITSKAK